MLDLTVSIVTYRSPPETLRAAVDSVLGSNLDLRLFVIDHSPQDTIRTFLFPESRLEYRHNPKNPGFGAGHNSVMTEAVKTSRYCLVLNPDVYFDPIILSRMTAYLDQNLDIGLLAPLVTYPDGKIQHLCKLLPTPADVLLRGVFRNTRWAEIRNARYELHDSQYNRIVDAPCLSGCFMLMRSDVLAQVGCFDERFFMYFEDFDLSRRIGQNHRTVFYPEVKIVHQFEGGAYKSPLLLKFLVQSGVRYFNKWGWFVDTARIAANTRTLNALKQILSNQVNEPETNVAP